MHLQCLPQDGNGFVSTSELKFVLNRSDIFFSLIDGIFRKKSDIYVLYDMIKLTFVLSNLCLTLFLFSLSLSLSLSIFLSLYLYLAPSITSKQPLRLGVFFTDEELQEMVQVY